MITVPKIKYAFCGMSLESGTKTVAYGHLIVYSFMFLTYLTTYVLESYKHPKIPQGNLTISGEIPHQEQSDEMLGFLNYDASNETEYDYVEEERPFSDIRSTFFLDAIVSYELVFSIYLVYGAQTKSPDHLLAWILVQIGEVFHSQIVTFLNLIIALHHEPWSVLTFILEEIILMGIESYCFIVVYNYSDHLKRRGAEEM